jgi:hypothetical protein
MKKALKFPYWLAFVLSFLIISCARHHDTPTIDCITRVIPSQASTVSAAQLDSIDALFSLNGLSTAGLQFTYFDVYNEIAINADGYLFYNGLPVFNNYEVFAFKAGIFVPASSVIYNGPAPGPDTSSHQTLEDLRAIYLAHYQQDTIFPAFMRPESVPGVGYRDSCLVAELGYVEPALISNEDITTSASTSLVKAWQVSPLSGGYPMVYILDSTGVCVPVQVILP